ncbi:hypothetical protein BDQ12DRAFT_670963 [Crucibulum laeve]|uniref:Uncharacterized protein n=1 Tax=Crucibulum laeve TaxID=68775 RepID=A0A5C3LJW4_9AGAR|nr:hypothetical protein BDQ12DRAFT_670963 [Crucibulum laeve]
MANLSLASLVLRRLLGVCQRSWGSCRKFNLLIRNVWYTMKWFHKKTSKLLLLFMAAIARTNRYSVPIDNVCPSRASSNAASVETDSSNLSLAIVITSPNTEYIPRSGCERNEPSQSLEVSLEQGNTPSIKLKPMTVSWKRYHGRMFSRERNRSELSVPPGTTDYTSRGPNYVIPAGWVSYTHPEGLLYFFHQAKVLLFGIANRLHELATDLNISLDGCETVIEIRKVNTPNYTIGYYCVHHPSRTIFWLHGFQLDHKNVLGGVYGIASFSDVKNGIESQYWEHIEFYPNDRALSRALFDELKETILHIRAELLEGSIGKRNAHSVCVAARFLYPFAKPVLVRSKFLNFSGQLGARLDNDKVLYKNERDENQFTKIFNMLSHVFFKAPNVHLLTLERIAVLESVGTVNGTAHLSFLKQRIQEWGELILNSTVIMTANVAFLAIPGVSTPNAPSTPAQILSYASTVSSIGGIVFGLLLVRKSRTKVIDDINGVANFMTVFYPSSYGKEVLAIMYSLPYALLMWGMIFFIAAVGCLVFQGTDAIARWTIGVMFTLLATILMWCIFSSWGLQRGSRTMIILTSIYEALLLPKRTRHSAGEIA